MQRFGAAVPPSEVAALLSPTTAIVDYVAIANAYAADVTTAGGQVLTGTPVTKVIRDVDTTQTSTFSNLPTGWSTPSGGGLHLTTTYEVDDLGRTTKETSRSGTSP